MLRSALRRIDPSIRFVDAFVLQDRVEPQTRSWRVGAMMFTMFAGLAVVVAGVGTFSIVAYVVEQRRHEIGVRMALGAEAGQVMRMLLRGAVLLTGAGVLIGGMVGLGRWTRRRVTAV
jgi:ABC-type antimicrobial peptide transport system permease subunit